MLTTEAFNALLKTLEEPPPNIVMILATTDAHKLPATIVSRCQRYDFKRLSNDDVIERLIEVCESEKVETEPSVLEMIARAAWGSLRDAENLLEQLYISYGQAGENSIPSEITEAQARELLGLGDTATSTELANALLAKDTPQALTIINREAQRGADLNALRSGTVDALRVSMLIKAGVEDSITQGSEFSKAMSAAARPARLNHIIHVLTELGQAEIGSTSSPLPLELAVLKATAKPIRPKATTANPTLEKTTLSGSPTVPTTRNSEIGSRPTPESEQISTPRRREKTPAEEKWDKVLWAMRRTKNRKFVVGPLLRNVAVPEPEGNKFTLRFKSNSIKTNFMEEMQDQRSKDALKTAITDTYGSGLELEVRSPSEAIEETDTNENSRQKTGVNVSAAQESAMVRAAMAMGAKVISEDTANQEPNTD